MENVAEPHPTATAWRRFLPLALLLFVLLAGAQRAYYFEHAQYEVADAALNGLQVERASQLRALTGHYSRWGFRHPGPAFFYLYALGERLFYDGLQLVPAPYNAHALTGLLVQVLFLVAALVAFSRQLGLRFFLPLALLFTTFHLALAGDAFYSIWPPHTLPAPFLAFLVATILLSSGRAEALPLAVVAGSLLVHNYVGQPLFVLPVFALGYLILLAHSTPGRSPAPGALARKVTANLRAFPYHYLAAALILLLFLTPLFLDALRGRQSNLVAIIRHLRYSPEPGKSSAQAVTYALSFPAYVRNPLPYVGRPGWSGLSLLLRQRGLVLLGWLLLLLLPFLGWRRRLWKKGDPFFRFLRRVYACFFLVCALMVVWGSIQIGAMYRMNGYFFYAALLLPWWLLAAALAHGYRRLASGGRALALTLVALALVPVVFSQQRPPSFEWDRPGLLAALSHDDPAARIKYLVFPKQEWPLAAAIALELTRRGYDFRVAPGREYLFTREKTLYHPERYPPAEVSVWHLVPPARVPPAFPFGEQALWLATRHPPTLDPTGTEITFGREGNAARYQEIGWGEAGQLLTWSAGAGASLRFTPLPAAGAVVASVHVVPQLPPAQRQQQRLEIRFNGRLLVTATVREEKTVSFLIPRALWNEGDSARLTFNFPDAFVSAHYSKVYGDYRRLAFAFRSLLIQSR